jgi:Domain of unknown function (DUF222)
MGAGLRREIEALAGRDLSVAPGSLGPEICEMLQDRNALDSQLCRWFFAFDQAQGFAEEQLTGPAWLRAQTTMSHGQSAAMKRVSRTQAQLPKLAKVWAKGETTFDHVKVVQAGISDLPEEFWDEVDAALALAARVMTAPELAAFLRQVKQSLLPEPKPIDETRHAARRLSVGVGFDGMSIITGRLTPEVGEKLSAALSAASRPDADGELRAPNQRTADALEHVLDTVLDCELLPVDGGEKPHITLSVDLDQLSESAQQTEDQHLNLNSNALWDPERPVDPDPAGRVAAAVAAATSPQPRFSWTGTTSTATGRRLSCDGILLPIFTSNGTPIDVGRRTRIVSSRLRAFVAARDRHCVWDGCRIPARWCDAHHVWHWRDGGPTDRAHLALLCPAHHRAAHSGRYCLTLHAPGVITVRRRTTRTDPYYEIRLTNPPNSSSDPPGFEQPTLTEKLATAARHLTT